MIKFFVSSTFKDMQEERDAIQLRLYPRLKNRLTEYGQELDFCDLRWGINTKDKGKDEEKMQHILEVCFKEIRECHPHFIVLLGECYGSMPSADVIPRVLEKMNAQGDKEFTRENIEGKSYTALEIEYGPFADRETFENTLFLFRRPIKNAPKHFNAQNDADREKMNQLKSQIASHPWGAKICEYELSIDENGEISGTSALIDLIENKLFEMLKPRLDKLLTMPKWEMERQKGLTEAKKRARCFYSSGLLQRASELLKEETSTLSICGSEGSGKSCLASRVILDRVNDGWSIYPIYLSPNEKEYSRENIFAKWAFYIRELINMPQPQGDSEECTYLTYDDFRALLYEYSKRTSVPLLLSLDCTNYLRSESVFTERSFIEEKIPNVYFITVIRVGSDVLENEPHHKYVYVSYTNEDKKSILEGQLRSIGKSLPDDIKELILNTHTDKSPAYFGLLIQRLIMIDAEDLAREYYDENGKKLEGIDQITKLQESIIKGAPENVEKLAWELINEMAQRLDNEEAYDAIAYICLSSDGIRVRDIERLFKNDKKSWDSLSFSLLVWSLECIFTSTVDGLVRIESKKIREYIISQIDTAPYIKSLVDYIMLGDGTNHLYADFIVHCSKIGDTSALLKMIKLKPYFLNASACKRLFSSKDAFNWLIDSYLSGDVDEKKRLHKLIDSFKYNMVTGYNSSYERLYLADVEALNELFALGEGVKGELGEAYSSLAEFTHGEKANEYHKKALDYMSGEDNKYIESIIVSHIDISRRSLYSNLPSAIKSINEATRLVYENKDSINLYSKMSLLCHIYERKLNILREISYGGKNPVATMRDDTDEILIDAFYAFIDASGFLGHLVNSSVKYDLLRNIIYYIRCAVLKKEEYVSLLNYSLNALKKIYAECENRYKSDTGITLFRIIAAFIEGLDEIGERELVKELCGEAEAIFEKIKKHLPSQMTREICEGVILIADIFNQNEKHDNARALYKGAEEILPRIDNSSSVYMENLIVRAKINIGIASAYYYMNENDLALQQILNAFDNLALMSSNAMVSYKDSVLEYTGLLSRVVSLYCEIVKELNDYKYMDSFINMTGTTARIINQSWESFIEAPFMQKAEAIHPIMYSYLVYLDKMSELSASATAEIWYMVTRDAYSLMLTRKNIVRFMGAPSGLLLLARGAYSLAKMAINKGSYHIDEAISTVEAFKKELSEVLGKRNSYIHRIALLALGELYRAKGNIKPYKKYLKSIPKIKTTKGTNFNFEECFYCFNLRDGTINKYLEQGCIDSFYELLADIRGKLLIATEAKEYKNGFDTALKSKNKEIDSMQLFVSVVDKRMEQGIFNSYLNLFLGVEFAMVNAIKENQQARRDQYIKMALCVLKSPFFEVNIESQNAKLSALLALRHIDVSSSIEAEITDTLRALLANKYEKTNNKPYAKIMSKLK